MYLTDGGPLGGDTLSLFEPATAEDSTTARGFHARAKANFLLSTTIVGIK